MSSMNTFLSCFLIIDSTSGQQDL
uniref:Uncharacterized protein n=1 Tax=Rhizophora mucronata TaxID=61149 RepID=A0A2P2PT08_RHIMU